MFLTLLVNHLEQRGVGRNLFEDWNIFWFWLMTEVSCLLVMTPTAINRLTNIKVDKQTSGFYDTDSSSQALLPMLQAHSHVPPKKVECSFLVCVTIQPVKHFTLWTTVRGFSSWNVLLGPSLSPRCVREVLHGAQVLNGNPRTGWLAFATSGARRIWLQFPCPARKLWESLFSLSSREGL